MCWLKLALSNIRFVANNMRHVVKDVLSKNGGAMGTSMTHNL